MTLCAFNCFILHFNCFILLIVLFCIHQGMETCDCDAIFDYVDGGSHIIAR